MSTRTSRSYSEIKRIWKRQQKLEREHEAHKQRCIEKYNREKMNERRRRDQESRRSSRHRRSRTHSRSRSSDRRSRTIHLSPSQLEAVTDYVRNNIFGTIRDTISEGRTDRQSQIRTDRRLPRTDSTDSRTRPRSSRDQRDHAPSTSGRHLDEESRRPRRSSTDRQRSSTARRHSHGPAPPVTENQAVVPNVLPTQNHSSTLSRPRSSERERERNHDRRCGICGQYHSSRDRNVSCRTRPDDGRYPPHLPETNHPPMEHRGHLPHRYHPIEQPIWRRNTGPYPGYQRGPAPYLFHNPNWPDIPPPEHLGYYPPLLPPPRLPYRGPYPPYGPGPNFRGYH